MTAAAILKYTDAVQRMEIAMSEGITSRQGVYNVIYGKTKNWKLLTRLIEKAEFNKNLELRAKQLETVNA